jgi:hypothetical protein
MGVFSRIRGSNNKKKSDDNKKQTGPTSSRMEERLRTARILAGDDDDDDEPNKRRTQAQIERDLSDPRVHKKIVENLYGAYKIRVRYIYIFVLLCFFCFSSFSQNDLFFSTQMRAEKSKNIASLLSLLLSLYWAFSPRARCVDERTDFATDGFKPSFLFDNGTIREREKERDGEGNRRTRANLPKN